ncbi:chaperonin CPN60-2, mitochondrial, partial [Tanacetum coccineum]
VGISERDDPEKRLEIAREVMQELRPPKKNGRPCGYGVGVTKSQVTKFSFDLRRMRRQGVSSENRFLSNKVAEQSKQIEKQSRKMNTMEENITRFIGELKTMLPDFFATRTSKTQACAIKAPVFGENQKSNLQDLATLTGGEVKTDELGMNPEKMFQEMLLFGMYAYIWITISTDDTVILDGDGDRNLLQLDTFIPLSPLCLIYYDMLPWFRSSIELNTSEF